MALETGPSIVLIISVARLAPEKRKSNRLPPDFIWTFLRTENEIKR
jgi:hypothetical protein